MSGGKSNSVTVGFKYFMDLHFGICHGPVDALAEIRVGGRTAYDTEVTASQTIYINEPKLFGGEKREGGIQGYADVLGGTPTQGVNEYLQEQIGAAARVPAYRGLFSLVYKGGLVSANNPYIKPWAFKVRRIISGWGDLGTEEVTELASDTLFDWIEDSSDPRNPDNGHQYKYDGIARATGRGTPGPWRDTYAEALADFEADQSASASGLVLMGWSYRANSDNHSWELRPQAGSGPAQNREIVTLHFNDLEPSAGRYPTLTAGGVQDGQRDCRAVSSIVSLNSGETVWWGDRTEFDELDTDGGADIGIYYRSSSVSTTEVSPRGLNNNNCTTGGGQLKWVPDVLIKCRRVPSAPEIPGSDLPDWPEDPTNYWWDESTGQIYSKEPWSQTAGNYRWLSLYSVDSANPSLIQSSPLSPVREQGDADDTQAQWGEDYLAAVNEGTVDSGRTYSSSGTGDETTYPRNETYAWSRTYDAIVPAEPPDAGIAQIGDDMNPAHIVRQCITNSEWGMGYPDALIGQSFTTAAQSLYDEGFGLSFQWTQQEPVEEFIGQVLNHCGGVWYADPRTGKFEMALIRDDYDLSDLPTFDESNILSVESYQKPGYGELVNEITVVWTDVPNNKTATTAPLQDPACIQAQGAVISEVRQYPGITKAALAQRVALRDLTAASTPLASIKLKVNREGWDLIPGKDCIILSWQKLGITQLVCRVLKVDRGTLEDGVVTLEVAEDVFGLPDAVYTTQESEGWTDPNVEPDDLTAIDLVESPYWDLARNLSAADLDYTDVDAGYVFTLAGRNSDVETSYGIWSRTGSSDYEDRGVGPYAATALLNGAIDQQETTINLDNGVDLDDVSVGDRVLIGSGRLAEFCEVLSLNTTTGVMTVNRAVLDTTPQEHSDNTRVWFVENSFGVDQTERATSDEVDVKLTAISTGGESDLEDATEQTIILAGRFGRPYPPGQIRVNGSNFPDVIDTTEDASDGFVITWAHRDRVQQDVDLVTQDENNIGPEAGTTYTVELYDDSTDALYDSVSGISGTSLSLSVTDSFQARLEVYSVRDGIESWQRQVRRFTLLGTDAFVTEDGDYFITEDGQILAPE